LYTTEIRGKRDFAVSVLFFPDRFHRLAHFVFRTISPVTADRPADRISQSRARALILPFLHVIYVACQCVSYVRVRVSSRASVRRDRISSSRDVFVASSAARVKVVGQKTKGSETLFRRSSSSGPRRRRRIRRVCYDRIIIIIIIIIITRLEKRARRPACERYTERSEYRRITR